MIWNLYLRMIKLFDYHIIKIDSVYDQRPTESGLIRLNAAWYREEKEMDRYERKLLSGTIAQVPIGYTEAPFMPIDPGIPNHKIYVGHDIIMNQRNIGYEWSNAQYHPGMKESIDFETIAEWGAKIDARQGEKCYFHPSVTEKENLVEEGLYRCAVHEIICVVRDGRPVPQGGYILIKPNIEEELESESGLITKLEGEADLVYGTVAYSAGELKPGQDIVFLEYSDWKVNIEGEELFAMREEDILLKCL